MLSIGRLLAGDDRERYYLEQVGQGRDDYYAGEADSGGEWAGTGAQSLGASGGVTADRLARHRSGRRLGVDRTPRLGRWSGSEQKGDGHRTQP